MVVPSFGFGHRARDVGLLPPVSRSPALRLCVYALQPLALTLGRRALAVVRIALSLICHLFAVVGDSVSLISDPISLVSLPLAACQVGFTSRDGFLALVEFGRSAIGFTGRVGGVFSDHDSG